MMDETTEERIARLEKEGAAMRMLLAFFVSQFERMTPGFADGAISAFDEKLGELLSEGRKYDLGPDMRAESISLLQFRTGLPKFPSADD
jgi:hypothetical protein